METKKQNTIAFIDGPTIKASCVYKTNMEMLKIQDIDLNEIKVSKEKPDSKANKAYKHFILYDHNNYNNKFFPLLIRLPKMIIRLKVFKDGKARM